MKFHTKTGLEQINEYYLSKLGLKVLPLKPQGQGFEKFAINSF